VPGDHGAKVGLIVEHAFLNPFAGLTAEQVVHRVEVIADGARVRHGIDQRELVGEFRQFGVHFVDEHSRDAGVDGHVRAAVVNRGFGFHVPRVNVTGAPAEEHKNARLLGSHCLAGFIDIVAAHDNPRQTHAESTEATGKHGLTTIELQVAAWLRFLLGENVKVANACERLQGSPPGSVRMPQSGAKSKPNRSSGVQLRRGCFGSPSFLTHADSPVFQTNREVPPGMTKRC
jgi:hypothetical protein